MVSKYSVIVLLVAAICSMGSTAYAVPTPTNATSVDNAAPLEASVLLPQVTGTGSKNESQIASQPEVESTGEVLNPNKDVEFNPVDWEVTNPVSESKQVPEDVQSAQVPEDIPSEQVPEDVQSEQVKDVQSEQEQLEDTLPKNAIPIQKLLQEVVQSA
jgi:uncharacterized Zn finger protein (UPF0148 family)